MIFVCGFSVVFVVVVVVAVAVAVVVVAAVVVVVAAQLRVSPKLMNLTPVFYAICSKLHKYIDLL